MNTKSSCPITDEEIHSCPIRKVLKIFGGKWALLILFTLKIPQRFGEIKKIIPDISEKMLIQTLKLLEKNNFIKRKDFKTIPPKVVYSIRTEGKKMLEITSTLEEVGKKLK